MITAAEMVLAGALPASLCLELAAPLTFLLLLLPMLTTGPDTWQRPSELRRGGGLGTSLGLRVLAGATAVTASGARAARHA